MPLKRARVASGRSETRRGPGLLEVLEVLRITVQSNGTLFLVGAGGRRFLLHEPVEHLGRLRDVEQQAVTVQVDLVLGTGNRRGDVLGCFL
jgi:hypothetical protein